MERNAFFAMNARKFVQQRRCIREKWICSDRIGKRGVRKASEQ